MSTPSRFRSDLWRRLAHAQDDAVEGDGGGDGSWRRELARAVAARSSLALSRGRRRWRGAFLTLAGAATAVAVGTVLLLHEGGGTSPQAPAVRGHEGQQPRQQGQAFVADARSDLPLSFSDGSTVIFRAGSAGRMQRLTGSGAELVLERGRLEAHVIHAETTLWLVHAGPYRVRVTGTRFALTWAANSFEVDLYEGAVIVDGSVLGAGVSLRAGQRLKIAAGVVLVDSLPGGGPAAVPAGDGLSLAGGSAGEAPAETAGAPSPSPSPTLAPVPATAPATGLAGGRGKTVGGVGRGGPASAAGVGGEEGDEGGGRLRTERGQKIFGRSLASSERWLVLAERGEYRQALAEAKRLGWSSLCGRLDARRLLTLGDVARYSGARTPARQAFQALVKRFPEDRLAADAVFSLGRLAFESSRPHEAMRWFRRYGSDWPNAPLADQAAGRLLECAIRVEDREAARSAARRYLARAPAGPHALLAKEVLDAPADGLP